MRFLGLGGGRETYLVAVTREGPGHLRLNGNHARGARFKRNAMTHSGTVCWVEFEPGGRRLDQGLGPAAAGLGPGAADQLLRDLPQTEVCRQVLRDLGSSPENSARWLPWAASKAPARGSMGDQGRS